MSKLRQHTATLLLPTVFFGYAIYANSTMLLATPADAKGGKINDLSLSYVIDGEATRDLDALYKSELPHRNPAVGVARASSSVRTVGSSPVKSSSASSPPTSTARSRRSIRSGLLWQRPVSSW
jgi:hypothetical protein